MTPCTAAARAVTTDAAAKMEQEAETRVRAYFGSKHSPSTAVGGTRQSTYPSTVRIRHDHPFAKGKTRTDADHHRR